MKMWKGQFDAEPLKFCEIFCEIYVQRWEPEIENHPWFEIMPSQWKQNGACRAEAAKDSQTFQTQGHEWPYLGFEKTC